MGKVEPYSVMFSRTYWTKKKKNKLSGSKSGYKNTRRQVTIPKIVTITPSWDQEGRFRLSNTLTTTCRCTLSPYQEQVAKPITELIQLSNVTLVKIFHVTNFRRFATFNEIFLMVNNSRITVEPYHRTTKPIKSYLWVFRLAFTCIVRFITGCASAKMDTLIGVPFLG